MLSHGSSGNRLITMLQAELPGPHALLLHEQTRAPARNWVTAGPVIYMPGITGQRTPPDVGTHAKSVSSLLVPCFLEQHVLIPLCHRSCWVTGTACALGQVVESEQRELCIAPGAAIVGQLIMPSRTIWWTYNWNDRLTIHTEWHKGAPNFATEIWIRGISF